MSGRGGFLSIILQFNRFMRSLSSALRFFLPRAALTDTPHIVFVDISAVADRAHAPGPFDLETGRLIQRDGARIVCKDGQLHTLQHQPVVGNVERRVKQRPTNAAALP